TQLPSLPADEQVQAAHILLKHCFELLRIERLTDAISQTIADLVSLSNIPRKELLKTVLFVIEHSEDLPAEIRKRWRQIEADIFGGDDFGARLRRYVGPAPWELHQAKEK